jgi:hypothetical protein
MDQALGQGQRALPTLNRQHQLSDTTWKVSGVSAWNEVKRLAY